FGLLRIVSVTGGGDINGTTATVQLTYKYDITYGFGLDDALNPKHGILGNLAMREARLLQLAGLAKPFHVSITVTMPSTLPWHTFTVPSDPPLTGPPAPVSTVPGFGTNPKIY